MTIIYRQQGIEFEWDDYKSKKNLEKHGVTFEAAAEAFFDPFYQQGTAFEEGEQRDIILGYSFSQRLLFVVYTERGNRQRIISARPTTRFERKLYEES